LPPLPKTPPRVLLDLRTDCNLKCPMCIVHGATDDPRLKSILRNEIGEETLDSIMAQLASFDPKPLVQPQLWSEPTLSHYFLQFLKRAKEHGLPTAINTNGLLLTPKLCAQIVELGTTAVTVSVDAMDSETLKKVRGITNLDKVERGIANLVAARGDAKTPRIGVSFTKQEANEAQEKDFIAKWIEKVDFIRVGALFTPGGFANIDGAPVQRNACPALNHTMSIHTNGHVSICCLDGFRETDAGNVLKTSVAEAWTGPEFTAVREAHERGDWDSIPLCKSCDRWASYAYQETVDGNVLIRKSPEYTYYNRIDRLESWSPTLTHWSQNQPPKAAALAGKKA
jgi:MoaA/NifB/PqqE/SkfB family radical SAM enzyme